MSTRSDKADDSDACDGAREMETHFDNQIIKDKSQTRKSDREKLQAKSQESKKKNERSKENDQMTGNQELT